MNSTIQELFEKNTPKRIFKTGISYFDRAFNGFSIGSINIFSGRPNMGKTSALLKLVKNMHSENGINTHWISYNDDLLNIATRFYNINKRSNQFCTEPPRNDSEDLGHFLIESTMPFAEIPELIKNIDSSPAPFCLVIENPEVFDAPYCQDKANNIKSILQAINQAIMNTKGIVFLSFNCSVDVEVNGGMKKPYIGDIPHFDQFYRNIDKAFTLWRPEYYGFEQDADGNNCYDITFLTCLYNKTGPSAEIRLLHRGVNNDIHDNAHRVFGNCLELLYRKHRVNVTKEKSGYRLILSNEDGFSQTVEDCTSKHDVWNMIEIHFEMENYSSWLDFMPKYVDQDWTKFLIGKLAKVFRSKDFEDHSIKQKYEYWLNKLAL